MHASDLQAVTQALARLSDGIAGEIEAQYRVLVNTLEEKADTLEKMRASVGLQDATASLTFNGTALYLYGAFRPTHVRVIGI